MLDRRLYAHIDWWLVAAILTTSTIGLLMIYSTTYEPTTGLVGPQLSRQLVALGIGLVAMLCCLGVDYRLRPGRVTAIYVGLLAMLIYTAMYGIERGGGQRWIEVGPFNLQVSEFARAVVSLALATLYATVWSKQWRTVGWLAGGLILAAPFLLIMRQPDLGTAATLLPICLAVMVFAGFRLKFLMVLGVVGILSTPIVWTYALEDYQRERLSTFANPEQDPRGAGYQQIQARITVGSGGLGGKGFLQGTQSQYNFLPAAHSDFIFSVLAEEHGFLGVLVALGLYLFIIIRSFDAARVAADRMGMLLVVGITTGFAFQVIYNITMSAGLAPVKGLPLPLMSYGGSSIIATLIGFGLILNVRMRRFTN
ncbi:MAG: rod shape-determining protein RodA [Acidobacteria bacterium]|nr:rod shape-determining protein RodA [Acidobacteriota bacterium]